jgi:hypothetical protein
MKPQLLTPLTDDQLEVIGILEQALELARDGKVDTIGVVVCLPEGPAYLIGGTQAASLYIATGLMRRDILAATEDPARRRKSRGLIKVS